MIWDIGLILMLKIGGVKGVKIENEGIESELKDKYYVVEKLKYVM